MLQEIQLAEHHPLVFNFSFSASMGILPPTMELKTSSCGIETSVFANEGTGDRDHTSMQTSFLNIESTSLINITEYFANDADEYWDQHIEGMTFLLCLRKIELVAAMVFCG